MFSGLKFGKSGLFFVFSHGMTGFGWMIWELISTGNIFMILSDSTLSIKILFGFICLLVLATPIYATIYTLSKTLKTREYSLLIAFLLPAIALLLTAIFPYIAKFI